MSDKFSKLPELAKPSVYDIQLKPCLKTFKCEGASSILLDVTKKTDFLKLHANELEIKNVSLELSNGSVLKDLPFELDKKWTVLTIKFPSEIEPQTNVKLNFKFVAELNNKMQGFSRSSYTDSAGNQRYLASTQFESTYARSSFPCWDEPVYKAKFNVALEVDENLIALSNMNVINEEKVDNEKKLVKYATTPIMSSYLVAFAVGDFEYIQTTSKGGIDVRVYTVLGKKHEGEFALNLAAKCLDWYSNFFGIPCPLPKCDLIAIPDFSMGAMENWGLVTYREVCLLVDPKKSSTLQTAHVALVVAHELAHFWFGNLVTMKWWTDLWLKEGFASFMEYLAVSYLCPEFNIWLYFIKDEVSSGFELDALRNSHPIEIEIDNPNELDEIYDSITYSKSNCINRMLCKYLGKDVFQKSICHYLNKFQYSNAETTDLWDSFSAISGQNIKTMMPTWTKQMGFPLITAEERFDGKKRFLKLKQSRFIADGGKDELNSVWHVPITIVTGNSNSKPKLKFLLEKPEEEFLIDDLEPNEWIKLNASSSGFYRVQYSTEMLEAILPSVKTRLLSVIDRYGIASDLFALIQASKISATQFFNYLSVCCKNENEYTVWSAIDKGISAFSNILNHHGDPALKLQFNAFICKVVEPAANRLGWEPVSKEGSQTGLLRALILSRLSKCHHKPTIQTALNKFDEHVEKCTDLVPDLRSVIYCVAGQQNSAEKIARLQNIFETSGSGEVERNCIVAMAQCTDVNLLEGVFKYGIELNKIRPQDLMTLFFGSTSSKAGQDFTYKYFKDNTALLLKIFGSANSTIFQRILKFSANQQCSSFIADDFQNFCRASFDEHSLKVLHRSICQTIEQIKLNEILLQKNIATVKNFLSQ